MLATLRRRLIVSHTLPLLVVLPVVGVALIYVLETQVLIDSLSKDLTGEARLVAEMIGDLPGVLQNQAQAQNFVNHIGDTLAARVMFLDTDSRLIASSDARDAERVNQVVEVPNLDRAADNQVGITTRYSPRLDAVVADVVAPVSAPGHGRVGAVRLSHQLNDVYDRFQRLRLLIAGVLLGGLALSAIFALVLALNLQRPLKQVTEAIQLLASSWQTSMLAVPAQGPEEVKVLVQSFNVLSERLRVSEAARNQLVANVVHELGRPLGALRAAARALVRGASEEAGLRRELLTGMEQEIERLRRLLDELVLYYCQSAGALRLEPRPTDLGAWIVPLMAPWREAALATGITWHSTIAPDLPTVSVDPDRLAQAFENLLSNAVKYTTPGGAVSVEAGSDATDVWFRVGDTGPGISHEDQAHIFDPFYRSQAGGRFPQGMGLGLTIARNLATAHGGWIEVDSEPGTGSRFTLHIPIGRGDGA
jgi:two-component system, OmpR family, sensor histidine kinase BaeS